MKILFFNDFRLGILKGDQVVDVTSVVAGIPHLGPHDLINGLIAHFEVYRPKIEAFLIDAKGVPVTSVRIRPPLPKPGHIDCMAVNYMEDGTRTEPAPINAFQKAPGAIIGPGDSMH
jgi:2-keto-4-pentenoate hydratase/2-oxohepta-3-ene-1,7-dioic acid hydratase in catechol pathway